MKILLALTLGAICAVNACNTQKQAEPAADKSTPNTTKTEPVKTEPTTKHSSSNAMNTTVTLKTDYGDMKIRLFDETPQHRDNFLKNIEEGFYEGLLFHRVINGFMIQGGDPNSRNAQPNVPYGMGSKNNPPQRVPYEFTSAHVHTKGALAAARDNNPQKASSDCQFYLVQGKKLSDAELNQIEAQTGIKYTAEQREKYKNLGGTPFLDNGYTVFGEIVEGLDIIDKIAAVETNRALGDRPVKDVKMSFKKN